MASDVVAQWETQDEVVPGAELINHFGIKLKDTAGTIIDDASEPLDRHVHVFPMVAPGDYFVECAAYNADETISSGPPLSAPVSVPVEPTAPVVVSLQAGLPHPTPLKKGK